MLVIYFSSDVWFPERTLTILCIIMVDFKKMISKGVLTADRLIKCVLSLEHEIHCTTQRISFSTTYRGRLTGYWK